MKKSIWISLFALLVVACSGGDGSGEDPIVSRDYINVTPNVPLLGDGDVKEIPVTASCRWTITYSETWLAVTPLTGDGNQTISISAGKNSTGKERTATLTIQGGNAPARTVMVTQAKASDAYSLSVNVSSLSFEAKGESKTFSISSNTNWTITKPDWCTISETSGSGNATITVTAAENPNQEQRTGQIVISSNDVAGVTIAVSQKAKVTGNAFADEFKVTFKDCGDTSDSGTEQTELSEIIAEGGSIFSAVEATDIYQARVGRGIKLGTSKRPGSLVLTLSPTIKISTIKFTARKYNDSELAITVNGKDFTELDGDFKEYTVELDGSEVDKISITTPEKRAYITTLTIIGEAKESNDDQEPGKDDNLPPS